MKYITNFILTSMCCLALVGCFKERIELNLNDQNKKVVVNAWLNDLDDNQKVNVSYTSNYLENVPREYPLDAKVSLYDGETTIDLVFQSNGDYLLPSDWKGEIGKSYTLEVVLEDDSYSATSILRSMPELTDVYYAEDESEIEFNPDSFLYDIRFSFKDTDGEGDGYYGIDYNLGTAYGDTMTNGEFIDDEFIDGEFFEDISLTGQDHMKGDTVILEVFSIGKDASRYLQDIIDEVFRGGIFDPAPVNVRSNFSNGALGYFITSGARRVEIVIE